VSHILAPITTTEVTVFCPQCKAEYRVGFTKCSDCDVELVDHLPVEKPATAEEDYRRFEADRFEPEAELVVIRAYPSSFEADLAKSILEAAGIESMVRGDLSRVHDVFVGGQLGRGVELLVRAEDAEDADKILDVDATDNADEPSQD
jgi:hypothetical protein